MVELMERSDWTSSDPGGAYQHGRDLEGTACHWPGTRTNAFGVESASKVASRLRGWRNYHLSRSWSDIGYNYALDQAGRIWPLRGLRRVGAHSASDSNEDANWEWVGVLFILGDEERPTAAMIDAFRYLRTQIILDEFPHATALTGHGQAPGVPGAQTKCPGRHVADLINDGELSGAPEEEDDMTPEQLLDALESDRGQGILANAVAKSVRDGHVTRREIQAMLLDPGDIRDAADRDTKQGRHLGTNMKNALIEAGLAVAISEQVVDDLLNYTNPEVDGGEDTVYRMIRDTRAGVAELTEGTAVEPEAQIEG